MRCNRGGLHRGGDVSAGSGMSWLNRLNVFAVTGATRRVTVEPPLHAAGRLAIAGRESTGAALRGGAMSIRRAPGRVSYRLPTGVRARGGSHLWTDRGKRDGNFGGLKET